MLAHSVVVAVSDRRRRSEIDATIRARRERRYGQCAGTYVVLYKKHGLASGQSTAAQHSVDLKSPGSNPLAPAIEVDAITPWDPMPALHPPISQGMPRTSPIGINVDGQSLARQFRSVPLVPDGIELEIDSPAGRRKREIKLPEDGPRSETVKTDLINTLGWILDGVGQSLVESNRRGFYARDGNSSLVRGRGLRAAVRLSSQ